MNYLHRFPLWTTDISGFVPLFTDDHVKLDYFPVSNTANSLSWVVTRNCSLFFVCFRYKYVITYIRYN